MSQANIEIIKKLHTNTILQCININKYINNFNILNDISFDIPENALVCIYGKSGIGKTTLLQILTLLDKDYTGSLNILNTNRENHYKIRHKIAYIYQNNCLLKDLNIYDNLTLYHKIHGININKTLIKNEIEFLNIDWNKDIAYLSGGEKQKINIARAILQKPSILFGDEITSNLDRHSMNLVTNKVIEMKNKCTIILVSHDDAIMNIADILIKIY